MSEPGTTTIPLAFLDQPHNKLPVRSSPSYGVGVDGGRGVAAWTLITNPSGEGGGAAGIVGESRASGTRTPRAALSGVLTGGVYGDGTVLGEAAGAWPAEVGTGDDGDGVTTRVSG